MKAWMRRTKRRRRKKLGKGNEGKEEQEGVKSRAETKQEERKS